MPASTRAGAAARATGRAIRTMPLPLRVFLIVAAVAVGFIGVVLPLFSNGGVPRAEIAGALPATVTSGRPQHVDIAVDNVGDSIIDPVCVALSGGSATLVSANFQGLDQVAASGNRVCGGQLTGQETISVTLVVVFNRPGNEAVQLVPQQAGVVIGPAFGGTVRVS